jgi:hypothetical protein
MKHPRTFFRGVGYGLVVACVTDGLYGVAIDSMHIMALAVSAIVMAGIAMVIAWGKSDGR